MPKHHFLSISILISALFFINTVLGQHPSFRVYTQEDGLPQSQVYDIAQDNIGYLWLGTQGGGLSSFDGKTFRTFKESDGLISNYIFSLYTSNDSLFVGTRSGLSVKTNKKFTNYAAPQVNAIFKNKDSQVFLATNTGIYAYVLGSKQLKKIQLHKAIDSNSVNAIVFDGKYYWIATNKGLWKANALENQPSVIEKYESNNFTSLVFHNGFVIAATYVDGTRVIDSQDYTKEYFLIKEPLRVNHLSIHDNKLWVATDHEGLTVLDTENYNVLKRIHSGNGLKVPHVRKVFTDNQSNTWIGTSGGGLYKYARDNNFVHYDKETGLKGNRIYALHATKSNVWASNSEKGIVKIDSLGIHHIAQHPFFTNTKIKTIASDTEGNIWAGTEGRGLLFREEKQIDSIVIDSTFVTALKIDKVRKTSIKNHLINTDTGFPYNWIRKVLVTDNAVWTATYASGIVKFNYFPENDSLVVLKTFGTNNGLKDVYIRDLQQDADGKLWFVTKKGHLGHIKNDVVTDLGKVLPVDVSIGTLLFNKDKIYLGTAGKGIWWATQGEAPVFQKLKGEKELYSNNIYQLIFDRQDNLWVGTEQGLDKVVLGEEHSIKQVFHYGRNDGFLGIETCLNATVMDNEGDLWFGAIYGLTKYQPHTEIKEIAKPKLHFEAINIAYKSIDSLRLDNWTNSNKVLQLKSTERQLGFDFIAVDINHPKQVQYRFKLNADDWSPWSKINKANFSGLSYGKHTFTAQSRNYRWKESTPITFQFFIDSPLYQKPWFQWSIFAIVIIILIGIGYVYLKRIRVKNKRDKEQLQLQNELLSLEHKALQLQMNPHFIFNVLNGIKAMGSNDIKKMNTTINSFASLLRNVLSNSRAETITLHKELETLTHYIKVEQLMSPKPFSYTIDVVSDLDTEEILIPPMLIQPFVENAIRHGILKGKREGKLTITFETKAEMLHCKIVDNGIGIFESQKNKVKTDHQSMALAVTKDRLLAIAGKDALEITEIANADKTIGGTQIAFTIPLETDY